MSGLIWCPHCQENIYPIVKKTGSKVVTITSESCPKCRLEISQLKEWHEEEVKK